MRKNIFYLTTIATILFFGSCSNEEFFAENTPETERTISLTASIPSDEPTTRVDLTQDGKSIILTWVVGDDIELLFKQGATEITQTVTVATISNEGKKAHFDVDIPPEITAGAFDLYGVYGGGGLSTSDPTKAVLPQGATFATSLNAQNDFSSVERRKDVMLYFASKNIQTTNPQVSVLFKHLGALFSITVTNIGEYDIDDLVEARLVEVGNSGAIWAYNTDSGGEEFDLVNEEFIVNYAGYYYISFYTNENYLYIGNSVTFWAWYPPLPNVVWPELMLELYDSNGELVAESGNTKPARTNPTMPGKAYYFYAELDVDYDMENQLLYFTEGATITDSRDGNVYKIVTIGDQVWMAENLKYLPGVVGPTTGSETVPYYYVYGYNGTDVNAAITTANYNTYGVLYNWPAAMAGEAGSSSVPSGVQGVCPDGWHLPSDAEWSMMFDYLGGTSVAGGKLKEAGTQHWLAPNSGATNSTGFTALPGGFRVNSNSFANKGINGYWYSATDFDVNRAFGPYMYYNDSEIKYNGLTKDYAFSIRCVKDVVNVGM